MLDEFEIQKALGTVPMFSVRVRVHHPLTTVTIHRFAVDALDTMDALRRSKKYLHDTHCISMEILNSPATQYNVHFAPDPDEFVPDVFTGDVVYLGSE